MTDQKITTHTWVQLGSAAAVAVMCLSVVWYAGRWTGAVEKDMEAQRNQVKVYYDESLKAIESVSKRLDDHIAQSGPARRAAD